MTEVLKLADKDIKTAFITALDHLNQYMNILRRQINETKSCLEKSTKLITSSSNTQEK